MKPKSSRFQLVVPPHVLEEIRVLAARQHRSISNMIVALLIEALQGQKESQKENVSGNRVPALREKAA